MNGGMCISWTQFIGSWGVDWWVMHLDFVTDLSTIGSWYVGIQCYYMNGGLCITWTSYRELPVDWWVVRGDLNHWLLARKKLETRDEKSSEENRDENHEEMQIKHRFTSNASVINH